ncbi:YwiC-like family protein [Paenibacillus sp. MMS20-IR301]|uniref:YwiC-like family protein n=1 Tax=Paenibacillus sp. MMS20-IR301 TaxID=2895946 RepID=UPI0028E8EF32|nr:YwiC-like family protein [Paenibacillus sp. MMS20-IR301]WNS40693.1 YwiC-like family protein [Paenibacillus sp. MMS20-IR301]
MKKYIPNQHGAWAMLVLPFLLGVAASRGQFIHIPLFVCWLLIYLFSFPLLQGVKTRKFSRYAGPLKLYGLLLIPFIVYLVIAEPALLWFVLPLVPLFAVNLYYAKTKNERALFNDISAILAFCLILYPVFYVGQGESWRTATELFLLAVLYFTGTALYVKTVIRERNNIRFYYASVLYHLLVAAAGLFLFPPLLVPLLILAARAAILPRTGISAKRTGMIEIGFSIMLYVSVLVLYF